MYLAPGKYHLTVHPGGGITISQDNSSPPIESKERRPLKGLARLWCKPSTFLAFANELERQGYTSNGEWIGNDPREIRALYEFTKSNRRIPGTTSLPKFFRAIKETWNVKWRHHNSIKFDDFEYQSALQRLTDIFSTDKE